MKEHVEVNAHQTATWNSVIGSWGGGMESRSSSSHHYWAIIVSKRKVRGHSLSHSSWPDNSFKFYYSFSPDWMATTHLILLLQPVGRLVVMVGSSAWDMWSVVCFMGKSENSTSERNVSEVFNLSDWSISSTKYNVLYWIDSTENALGLGGDL